MVSESLIFDDAAYIELQELCMQSPQRLREAAHEFLPDTMKELRSWQRSDLIPLLFVHWLRHRNDKPEEVGDATFEF